MRDKGLTPLASLKGFGSGIEKKEEGWWHSKAAEETKMAKAIVWDGDAWL